MNEGAIKHYIQYIVCSSSSSPLFHQILSVRKLRDTYSNFSSLCILLYDNNEEKTRLRYGMVFIWEYGKTAVENVTFRIELLDSRSGWVESRDENEVMIFFFISPQISQVLDSEYKYATYFYFLRKCISRKKLYGKVSTLHVSVVVFTFILFLISSFRYGRIFVFNDFLWC